MENPFLSLDHRLRNIEMMLHDLNNHLSTAATARVADGELLTVPQAAHFLNLKVNTVYTLVRQRELPANKRGKRLYFLREDLLAYVKSGRRKTMQELEQEAEIYLNIKQKGGK